VSAAEQKARALLAELTEVRKSPDARDPVEALKGQSREG